MSFHSGLPGSLPSSCHLKSSKGLFYDAGILLSLWFETKVRFNNMKCVLTMIPLKAVLAHASTSWDGAWPLEPLDITVWEKVPVGGRLAPTIVGPGVGGPSPRGFGGPWVVPEEGRPAAGL